MICKRCGGKKFKRQGRWGGKKFVDICVNPYCRKIYNPVTEEENRRFQKERFLSARKKS